MRQRHSLTSLPPWPLWLIGLLGLLWALTQPLLAEEEVLPPERVFPVTLTAPGPDALLVTWNIREGYYLYKSKLRFRTETPGIQLGEPLLPEAEIKQDPFFGEVAIYRGRLEVRLPLIRTADAPPELNLEIGSQGCADRGLCYPPHRQTLGVRLPPLAPTPAPKPAAHSLMDSLRQLGRSPGPGGEESIPDPEVAYQLSARLEGPDRVRLIWTIAEGTFLYKEKLRIALEPTPGLDLDAYQLPEAELRRDGVRPDGTIGDVEVYQGQVELLIPLRRADPRVDRLALRVEYQGCAERGICYPPMRKRLELDLPPLAVMSTGVVADSPAPGATRASPAVQEPLSEQDRIAQALRGDTVWLVIASFFGFGLLLAFTPCMFPMIPILSGIIAGQGRDLTPRRAFLLSLVYVLAMAFTYTLAGILAGLFGQNLPALFQNPWILASFALVFVALALSMFGFYNLQLPAGLQGRLSALSNRQEGGTLLGVAIMGLLSALIVGPCLAPPLAGALIFIGQTGDWALGGMALFALAMGMGTPLIALGTSAGKLLPRAGAWMDTVKAVFGVLLLAVAILLLERILPVAVSLVLWGGLLICASVYMGALRDLPVEATGWARLWKGLGVVLLIYGALMLAGAAAGGRDILQPLRGLGSVGALATEGLAFTPIKTTMDLDRELAQARAAGRPVMLDFYADWCASCKELERHTFSDPRVATALRGFTLLRADVTANDTEDQALLQGRFGLPGPPVIAFYGADGQERQGYRVVGFMAPEAFAAHVAKAVPHGSQ